MKPAHKKKKKKTVAGGLKKLTYDSIHGFDCMDPFLSNYYFLILKRI